MGMSSSAVGFRPPDEDYKKMKAIWDACKTARVPIPEQVEKFFDYRAPDPQGVEVDIKAATKEWADKDACDGLEVDVTKLPAGVKIVRFMNCW